MGDPTSSNSLYHPDMRFDYHSSYATYLSSFETAHKLDGDCSKADRTPGEETYQLCAHFTPESWGAKGPEVPDLVFRGVLEPPNALNMLASQGWFIPRFTAQRDPSLLSYIGMQGETNRHKLAEAFKRPQTWQQYCQFVSGNNCSIPDKVAMRPPNAAAGESERMYVEGLYKGYFLATDKNNCTANPDTCTGFFLQYPCQWRSNVPTQLHYLNISLDPDVEDWAHSFPQMVDIYRAAKTNHENVIVHWWSPELLIGEMAGTDAEFTPVALPLPTQACMENKPGIGQHCAVNPLDRLGPPEAVCGESAVGLRNLMSTTLFTRASMGGNGKQNVEAIFSPAHAALTKFELTELQLAEWFTKWNELGDPRQAACDWIAEHPEYLESFIPRSYPRIPIRKDPQTPLMYASTILGGIVMGVVLLTMILVYENRHLRAIQYAQIEFLGFLLVGSLLIAIGAIIMGAPPSSGSCIAVVWFINLGYTLELVPLVVKVAAVNHITQVGNSMRHAKIKREFLFGVVFMISLLVLIYLVVWSVIDPPKLAQEYELTDTVNEDSETIVLVLDVCASESMVWTYLTVGWNAFLLLCTTVLAIQMRKVPMEGFCETPTLALLVYSHMVFVLLRVVTYLLSSEEVSEYTLARCQSIIFSADTAATIVIYFLPKFLAKEERQSMFISAGSLHSTATFNSTIHAPQYTSAKRSGKATESTVSSGVLETPTLAQQLELVKESATEADTSVVPNKKEVHTPSHDKPAESFECNDEEEAAEIVDPLLKQLQQTQQRNEELENEISQLKRQLLCFTSSPDSSNNAIWTDNLPSE